VKDSRETTISVVVWSLIVAAAAGFALYIAGHYWDNNLVFMTGVWMYEGALAVALIIALCFWFAWLLERFEWWVYNKSERTKTVLLVLFVLYHLGALGLIGYGFVYGHDIPVFAGYGMLVPLGIGILTFVGIAFDAVMPQFVEYLCAAANRLWTNNRSLAIMVLAWALLGVIFLGFALFGLGLCYGGVKSPLFWVGLAMSVGVALVALGVFAVGLLIFLAFDYFKERRQMVK